MIDFFTFWVSNVWGSMVLSILGTAIIFAFIGILGRMSYMLLTVLLILFAVTFSVAFGGLVVYLLLFLLSVLYLVFQIYKLVMRE
jgi:hypothetical protein